MRQRRRNVGIRVGQSAMEASRFDILNGSVEPVVMLLQMMRQVMIMMMLVVVIVPIRRGVQVMRVRIGRVAMCDEGGVWEMRQLGV